MSKRRQLQLVVPLALALGASAAPAYAAAPKPHHPRVVRKHHATPKPKKQTVRRTVVIGGAPPITTIPLQPAPAPALVMIAVMPVR
jgi:hypothetical protein